MSRLVPLSCGLVLLLLSGSRVEAAEAAEAEPNLHKKMPWHLVDLWWDFGRETPFESYSLDVTLSEDVSPDVNLYVAPIGLGHLSKTPFYGGLQTQSDGNTTEDRRLRKIGRGLLLSMWEERRPEAIRPSQGGFWQSSGHEGDFVSVRRPYAWTKGTYTYRIARMDKEIVDGQPATWVGAFLHAHATNENIFIGALRFPGENLIFARKAASFVEIYGAWKPASEIPYVTVTFANPRINGEPVEKFGVSAIYPAGVPDYAEAVADGQQVVITVGQPIESRAKRNVSLIQRAAAE